MSWDTQLDDSFVGEFNKFPKDVQDDILARSKLLQQFGPTLSRPHVDTLKGSAFSNMKELRFDLNGGVWRMAFAFDPSRKAILLCAGNKVGKDQRKFYKKLIAVSDKRFTDHCNWLKQQRR